MSEDSNSLLSICTLLEELLRYPESPPPDDMPPDASEEMWQRAHAFCAWFCPDHKSAQCHGRQVDQDKLIACIRDGPLQERQYLLAESFLSTAYASEALHREMGWLNGSSLTIHEEAIEYSSLKKGIRSVTMPFLTAQHGELCLDPQQKTSVLFARLLATASSTEELNTHPSGCPGWQDLQAAVGKAALDRAAADSKAGGMHICEAVAQRHFASESVPRRTKEFAAEQVLLRSIAQHIKHCREEAQQESHTQAIAQGFAKIAENAAHPLWNALRCIYIPYGEIIFRFMLHAALQPEPSWGELLSLLTFCTEDENGNVRIADYAQRCLQSWVAAEVSLADSSPPGWFGASSAPTSENDRHADWRSIDPWWSIVYASVAAPFFTDGITEIQTALSSGLNSESFAKVSETVAAAGGATSDQCALHESFSLHPLVNPRLLRPILGNNEGLPRAIVFLPYTPIRAPITRSPLVTFMAGTMLDAYGSALADITEDRDRGFREVTATAREKMRNLALFTNLPQKIVTDDVIDKHSRESAYGRAFSIVRHDLKNTLSVLDHVHDQGDYDRIPAVLKTVQAIIAAADLHCGQSLPHEERYPLWGSFGRSLEKAWSARGFSLHVDDSAVGQLHIDNRVLGIAGELCRNMLKHLALNAPHEKVGSLGLEVREDQQALRIVANSKPHMRVDYDQLAPMLLARKGRLLKGVSIVSAFCQDLMRAHPRDGFIPQDAWEFQSIDGDIGCVVFRSPWLDLAFEREDLT